MSREKNIAEELTKTTHHKAHHHLHQSRNIACERGGSNAANPGLENDRALSLDDKLKAKKVGRNTSTSSITPGGANGSLNRQKLRETRRRIREKKRSPGTASHAISSDALSSENDSDVDVFEHNVDNVVVHNVHPVHHLKRAPPNANMAKPIRGSKSQSDLDADCEDNVNDYDSASIASATDLIREQNAQHCPLFVPAPPSDIDAEFGAHVEEIRVAGMKHLSVQEPENTASETSASDVVSTCDKDEKKRLLKKVSEQDERITLLERVLVDLRKQIKTVSLENELLKKQNNKK